MANLFVRFDAKPLIRWASDLSAGKLKNAVRRALDQSGRAARKEAIDKIASDIGAPAAKYKDAVPLVRTTKANDLSVIWTIKKARIGIMNTTGAKVRKGKGGGLTASTYRLHGGGSAELRIPSAFAMVGKSGNRIVVFRTSKARTPVKTVYAEHPASAMGLPNAPAAKHWETVAKSELDARLPIEIGKALNAS